MNPNEAKLIADMISRPRLAPYLVAASGDLVVALRLYAWNTEASGAFSGALQYFEVMLRNVMDDRLATHHGQREWWCAPRLTLNGRAYDEITKANRGVSCTADDVVAALSLGFWVSLLSSGSNYHSRLWWPALQYAFPGYSARTPAVLHQKVDHLRRLRNRVAHCEPIHHRHLAKDFESLLEVIRLISPEAAACLQRLSRIPEVLGRRAGVLDGGLSPRF
ncbi:hypothetical protein AB0395_02955 [Streptosporangium sp. NPDC051023]|uniref:hypothetical protein n=1 Tax=Streptosporangium sp. NPDC051023 TaxID=3155410 RepID=UPI00344DD787